MDLIIPTLVYVATNKQQRQSSPSFAEDGESAVIAVDASTATGNVMAEVAGAVAAIDNGSNPTQAEGSRPFPAFRHSSIDYLPELSFEQIVNFYNIVKNRVDELNFSKLRLWLVYENIFSSYEPEMLNENLLELREQIKDYLNIPVVEINVLALVRNKVRLGTPLQTALQKAAKADAVDYVLVLNNSNLGWVKRGNILQLSEEEFYRYGLRMLEHIHFANILFGDLAFSFNSLSKRRFYFTISSSFNDFSLSNNNNKQNKAPADKAEICRFSDAVDGVRDCLQEFFTESFRLLKGINQADVFGFLNHGRSRNDARQLIFQALQLEYETKDDLLNTLYKRFQSGYFKKIEQVFTLVTVLAIFQNGLLETFKEIREYIAVSTDLEKAKKILPDIIGGKVINRINNERDEKLRILRLDRDPLEKSAWKSEAGNRWKRQFDKNSHSLLRKIFEKNLEIIEKPEKSALKSSTMAAEDFLKPQPIEYNENAYGTLGSREADLILALRHLLKMVLKNALENSYMTVQENFLLLNKNRIRDVQSVSDLNDAYVICKQLERFKDFLGIEEIDKNRFLDETRRKFRALVADYLNRAELSDYTPEIMARDVARLLYSSLNDCKKNQSAPARSAADKKIEELPAFFNASAILSDYASPVLSVVFTREKAGSFRDHLWLIQNIDHYNQKFSLYGPWDEQTCFE